MDKEKIEKAFKGKRKNENLVVLLILLVIVVIAVNYIWSGDNTSKDEKIISENIIENYVTKVSDNRGVNGELENKLETILSNIIGVGKVKVMITYSNSSIIEPMYDENYKESNTIENDDSGGTRIISEVDNQRQIIYKQNLDGSKEPITKNTVSPTIEGAIITAEGADSAIVKSNIVQAVEAATGLPTHKIQVFEMEVN